MPKRMVSEPEAQLLEQVRKVNELTRRLRAVEDKREAVVVKHDAAVALVADELRKAKATLRQMVEEPEPPVETFTADEAQPGLSL